MVVNVENMNSKTQRNVPAPHSVLAFFGKSVSRLTAGTELAGRRRLYRLADSNLVLTHAGLVLGATFAGPGGRGGRPPPTRNSAPIGRIGKRHFFSKLFTIPFETISVILALRSMLRLLRVIKGPIFLCMDNGHQVIRLIRHNSNSHPNPNCAGTSYRT